MQMLTTRVLKHQRLPAPAGRESDLESIVGDQRAALHQCAKRAVSGGLPHKAAAPPWQITPTGACGLWRDGWRAPCGRRRWPCASGSRDGACAPVCWVDRSASRSFSAAKSASDCLVEGNSPINEVKSCDVGPEVDQFRSKMNRPGQAGPSRTVGAAYTGAGCFRQSWGLVQRAAYKALSQA